MSQAKKRLFFLDLFINKNNPLDLDFVSPKKKKMTTSIIYFSIGKALALSFSNKRIELQLDAAFLGSICKPSLS